MLNKIIQLIKDYDRLTEELSKPELTSNIKKYTKLTKEEKYLSNIIPNAKKYIKKHKQLEDDENILKGDDSELKELVKDEIVELKENIQKVTDSILVLLSSKSFEDVYSVQGKFKLKDEVTTRVNRFLVVGHVKDAYFTEFIIQ